MILSKVDDFFNWLFKDLNGNFDVRSLFLIFIGILIGAVLTASIYGIIVMVSLKKQEKQDPISLDKINDQVILEEVDKIKKEYKDITATFTPTEKVKVLGRTILNTVKKIAEIYYPNSKYPLYELTLSELVVLTHYIADRIDKMFDKRILKPFKNMSISQVLRILDIYKGIQERKIAKAVKKTGPVRKVLLTILNYANPIYWFKRLIINGTINSAVSKVSMIVIDIVADETNKVYSKNLFNVEKSTMDDAIQLELKEMEDYE